MSNGKDLKNVFQSVIRCFDIDDLKIKKMIYLYLSINSKECPTDALMVVNQFQNDMWHPIGVIWALALRTASQLGVPRINEFLSDCVIECLNDQDPYVLKTALLAVQKMLVVSVEFLLQKNLKDKLENLLRKKQAPIIGI